MADDMVGTPQLYRFLDRALTGLRWGTVAALLALTVIHPQATNVPGWSDWMLLLVYAVYSLIVPPLTGRLTPVFGLRLRAGFDLPVGMAIYLLGAKLGGPLYVLVGLAVFCGALSLSLRGSLLYTGLAAALVAAGEPLLMPWTGQPDDLRGLGSRLIMLGLAGVGLALLRRRLMLEQVAAQRKEDEAARLAELGRLRTEFVASVSHDLRTPFTAMRAGLGLVTTSLADRLRPDERNMMGNVGRNIDRLGILLDDLLAANQIDAGILTLERTPLDGRAIIADAVELMQPLMAEQRQTLTMALPEPLPLHADGRRLEQVLVNLLDNAHRHTPPGSQISVSGRAVGDEVRIVVADNGAGIPPDQREAVFGRFYRGRRATGGSGLGLAIARALVELHGGRIWAAERPGGGAAFHIVLPQGSEGSDDETLNRG